MTSETIENDGLNFEEIEKDVKKTSFGHAYIIKVKMAEKYM